MSSPHHNYYCGQLAASLGPDVPPVALHGNAQFEVLNFVRTVQKIRDAVSAELEPVTVEEVTEYLELLARRGGSFRGPSSVRPRYRNRSPG